MAEAASKKRQFYKPLPKEFRRDGFRFRLVTRKGHAAVYSQTWTGCPNAVVCFELIRLKQREGFEINGRFVPPGEVYPRSEQWGELGWTLCSKDAAFAKQGEICR